MAKKAKIVPKKLKPSVSAETYFLVSRKGAPFFSAPVQHVNLNSERFVGVLPKGSTLVSLGKFASKPDGRKAWVEVIGPLGVGWARLSDLRVTGKPTDAG